MDSTDFYDIFLFVFDEIIWIVLIFMIYFYLYLMR
jgi:hypothetical protein